MRDQVHCPRLPWLALALLASACDGSLQVDSGEPGPAVEDLSARLHPSLGSVVYVSWTQVRETDRVHVSYGFDQDVLLTTPSVPGTLGEHEQIVLGVPYGASLEWSVVTGQGTDAPSVSGPSVDTQPAPTGLPEVALDIAQEPGWEPTGRYLLTSVSEYPAFQTTRPTFWLAIVDRQGRYVWAQALPVQVTTLYAKPSRDGGAILYDASTWWTTWDMGAASRVRRILLDGSEERAWSTPGLAHAFDDLDGDTIAWFASPGYGDVLQRVQHGGQPEVLWRCQDWIRTSDLAQEGCYTNALFYDEGQDTWTFSLPSHETVVVWSEAEDEVVWYSDPSGGHGYTLTEDSPVWHWQHEAKLLSPDRLLLSSGVEVNPDGSFTATAAYEYAIDHDAQTLDLVWSHQADPEFIARYKGGAERLAGGNTLQFFGSSPAVQEVTPDGEVVWQVRFLSHDQAWIGRSTWLDDLYDFAPPPLP